MTRLYHGNTKIFFPNPYVLRVSYPKDMPEKDILPNYRELTRRTYKLIKGTWGYSGLETETVRIKDEFNHQAPPGPGYYAGMPPGVIIASLFQPDFTLEYRGYFCFKEEMDALQFRLSLNTNAIHVHMWPSERTFIIHEVVEDDES